MERIEKGEKHDVSSRWMNQYFYDISGKWSGVQNHGEHISAEKVYNKILAIEVVEPLDLDAIDQVIGNKCWTRNHCSECHKTTRKPIVSFDTGDGTSVFICKSCLKKALKLLKD